MTYEERQQMTFKERLIQDIRYMPRDKTIVTQELLDSGPQNRMVFKCPQESLLQIINNMFDDDLYGNVPNGYKTKIIGWEIIDMPQTIKVEGEE